MPLVFAAYHPDKTMAGMGALIALARFGTTGKTYLKKGMTDTDIDVAYCAYLFT